MKWLIENPITIWMGKLFIAKREEFKHRNKNLKIGYLSYAKNCTFGIYITINKNINLNEVSLMDFTYIDNDTSIIKTTIGKFCSIGPNCKIGLGKHPSNTFVSTHPIFFSTSKQAQITFSDRNYFNEFAKITIGNDVWIGANVIIVDGITISDGAIIAAGAVVTKNIPAYAIVGGVPAKIIKYRFREEDISKLLQLRWWDMDIEFLKKNYKKFHNLKSFLKENLEITRDKRHE